MKTRVTSSVDFDRFWAAYPRHTGKLAAQRKFLKMVTSPELLEKILAALAWQSRLPQWQDEDFVPHASTYLHNARWEDEPPKKLQAGERQRWSCPHVQHCSSREHCENATILGRPVKA